MPWKETCRVRERLEFVEAVTAGDWTVSELCREYGISRKTGYKWLERHREEGRSGLSDRSRARVTQPHRVTEAIRKLVLDARRKHPTWGAKKLLVWLERKHPGVSFPSRTTITSIITKAGLVEPRRSRRRLKGGMGRPGGDDHPNGVWSTDFKGQHKLGDGSYCYPLTVTDSFSRYVLRCRGLPSIEGEAVLKEFRRLFEAFGLPERIRSDNGTPFASRGAGRLTRLAVFWIDQGIALQRIAPGCPQQNGRHERMHLTLKRETSLDGAPRLRSQQARYDKWVRLYNEERPHEGLDFACPADLYERSERAYVEHPEPPEYPSHWVRRRVQKNGSIKLLGHRPFISGCLCRRDIGLVETGDGIWQAWYRTHPLGQLDTSQRRFRIEPIPAPRGSM